MTDTNRKTDIRTRLVLGTDRQTMTDANRYTDRGRKDIGTQGGIREGDRGRRKREEREGGERRRKERKEEGREDNTDFSRKWKRGKETRYGGNRCKG